MHAKKKFQALLIKFYFYYIVNMSTIHINFFWTLSCTYGFMLKIYFCIFLVFYMCEKIINKIFDLQMKWKCFASSVNKLYRVTLKETLTVHISFAMKGNLHSIQYHFTNQNFIFRTFLLNWKTKFFQSNFFFFLNYTKKSQETQIKQTEKL